MLDEIGRNIRKARIGAGLTQEALSARLGLKDRRYISIVEQGKQNVTATRLLEIAAALGVTPGTLLDEVKVRKAEPEV